MTDISKFDKTINNIILKDKIKNLYEDMLNRR